MDQLNLNTYEMGRRPNFSSPMLNSGNCSPKQKEKEIQSPFFSIIFLENKTFALRIRKNQMVPDYLFLPNHD